MIEKAGFFLFEVQRRICFRDFRFKKEKGQATVEYVLMLASVIAGALILAALFHKKLMGGFFTIIGLVIGAGTPT